MAVLPDSKLSLWLDEGGLAAPEALQNRDVEVAVIGGVLTGSAAG